MKWGRKPLYKSSQICILFLDGARTKIGVNEKHSEEKLLYSLIHFMVAIKYGINFKIMYIFKFINLKNNQLVGIFQNSKLEKTSRK